MKRSILLPSVLGGSMEKSWGSGIRWDFEPYVDTSTVNLDVS